MDPVGQPRFPGSSKVIAPQGHGSAGAERCCITRGFVGAEQESAPVWRQAQAGRQLAPRKPRCLIQGSHCSRHQIENKEDFLDFILLPLGGRQRDLRGDEEDSVVRQPGDMSIRFEYEAGHRNCLASLQESQGAQSTLLLLVEGKTLPVRRPTAVDAHVPSDLAALLALHVKDVKFRGHFLFALVAFTDVPEHVGEFLSVGPPGRENIGNGWFLFCLAPGAKGLARVRGQVVEHQVDPLFPLGVKTHERAVVSIG